jgi:hypothetical protein
MLNKKVCACVHLLHCICRGDLAYDPEEALVFLGKYCKWAVVTLASKGCMAKHGKQVIFTFNSSIVKQCSKLRVQKLFCVISVNKPAYSYNSGVNISNITKTQRDRDALFFPTDK